ncbi:MAG: ATP-binding cassette domain-containing protein, partial [Phycisphaerales bacterium]|nr:ATP-binding cassette domain-containing protein [Phycisphaerales bacterium]
MAQQGPGVGEAVIRLVGVRKRFGAQVVLDGLDLEIAAGQTIVVLGPSGSGKSVLLKHIVGLIRPDSGEVWFGDQRVDTMSERGLGAVRKQI